MILEAKFCWHLPLSRQSETYARKGIELDTSTLADWVGACSATLSPLVALIQAHVTEAGWWVELPNVSRVQHVEW